MSARVIEGYGYAGPTLLEKANQYLNEMALFP
jgi:hypothetical protein